MNSHASNSDEELEALKTRARALRRKRWSYEKIGAEIGRDAEQVRRWLVKRAAKKQKTRFNAYINSDKGREARRRYEAKRTERRRAASALRDQAIAGMLD